MKTPLPSRALLSVLLALPACGVVHLHDGIREKDGVLYADDVPLRHERWVKVEEVLPGGTPIELASHTAEIALSGGELPHTCSLEVHVFSEVEGDGVVTLDDGKLRVHSGSPHQKVALNGVRGTVPADHALEIESGTGDILLEGLAGSAAVETSNGTGRTVIRASATGRLSLASGTGDIQLVELKVPQIHLETGTGDIQLEACVADELHFESGTGDLEIAGSTFKSSHLESGTGDIVLRRATDLGDERHDLGTGQLQVIADPPQGR